MIRSFLALAALALALAVPGLAAERRHTVTDYDRILVEGPFEVRLATGRAPSALVSGSAQAIENVSIDVQGRTLRIRPNRSAWGGYPGEGAGGVIISLSAHDLRGATVTGSASLAIDKAKAMRFDAGLSGSGSLSVGTVEADTLVVGLAGSGRIAIGGRAKILRASVQGSGDLDAAALAVEDAELQADTSGRIALAAKRTARVTATGPGEIDITGPAACTVKATGSGRVRCGSPR